ncbi:MAG: hypothetical protein KA795_20510 [Burkholderiaceae bacterium]|nr:hypothetical protein [Burkholderiaceae bacterium]
MPHLHKPVLVLVASVTLALPAQAQFGNLMNILGAGGGAPKPEQAAAAAQGTPSIAQATPEQVQAALAEPVVPLDAGALAKGNAALKGKRFYVAEYRVLFEVGGSVSANTRAAYLGGTDYGGTNVRINYLVPAPDVALLQAITDRAYADFVARLQAAGLSPEPADAFVRENGAVYEATQEATRPGSEVYEDAELGYGKRKYMVFVPTGTKMVPRGFAGIGAGNIGKRIDYSRANLEGVSVGMVVNLAAQESSGSSSALFKRGSSANASAAMEITAAPKHLGVLQTHANAQFVNLGGPLAVPGQFASLREVGGYDTQKDAGVKALQLFGALTMGVAGNSTRRVDMALDVDNAALARHALQGMAAVNQAAVAGIN